MLKIYLSSVIIYFIMFMAEGILFRDVFLKAKEKLKEMQKEEVKQKSVISTTFMYLLVSCIPIIRLIFFVTKCWITFNPEGYIKMLKEAEEEKKKNE